MSFVCWLNVLLDFVWSEATSFPLILFLLRRKPFVVDFKRWKMTEFEEKFLKVLSLFSACHSKSFGRYLRSLTVSLKVSSLKKQKYLATFQYGMCTYLFLITLFNMLKGMQHNSKVSKHQCRRVVWINNWALQIHWNVECNGSSWCQ